MKLLFIANSRIPSERAMGTAIMKQCEAFARAGITVLLVVPRRCNDLSEDPFEYHAVERNFTIAYLSSCDLPSLEKIRLRYIIQKMTFFVSLFRYVMTSDADVLYTREPELIGPLPRGKVKIVEVHHLFGLRHFGKRYLLACAGVITITHALKEDLVAMFQLDPARVQVAPSGVDLSLFADTGTREVARANLNITTQKPIAMYIGALEEWKGYITFLSSLTFLDDKVQLVVIGGTEDVVAKLRQAYPSVLFLGTHPPRELPLNQKVADVLVVPNSGKEVISARHTSPLKVFTHMASGVPIVASDVPSIREILSPQNAIIVAPDDPHALAEGIMRAIVDTAHSASIAEQAKKDVVQYDWKNRTNRIQSYIHEFSRKTHE